MPNSDSTKTKTSSSNNDKHTHLRAEVDHLRRQLADRGRRLKTLENYRDARRELHKALLGRQAETVRIREERGGRE